MQTNLACKIEPSKKINCKIVVTNTKPHKEITISSEGFNFIVTGIFETTESLLVGSVDSEMSEKEIKHKVLEKLREHWEFPTIRIFQLNNQKVTL